jgi:putative acetyltransferase
MIQLIRTDASHPHFIALVQALDAELALRDGTEHDFYAQFNTLGQITHAVVAYEGTRAVGCGAIKPMDDAAMEVKRMYTVPEKRGAGVAGQILRELEQWAQELGYRICRLETGKRQPEAIRLYEKKGYGRIPNYGQYAGVENSVCFEKKLQ